MEYTTTIGIDVSDKTSKICVMAKGCGTCSVVIETTCATTKEGFTECLAKFDRSWLVVFETGTHCRWMNKLIREMGFRVIVANPAKVKLISQSNNKNDKSDAAMLARLALADLTLLCPVKLRDEPCQQMLRLIEARCTLQKARTTAIVQLRSFAKSMGFRLPNCSTERFHKIDTSNWPDEFKDVARTMLTVIKAQNAGIDAYDKKIKRLANTPKFKPLVDRACEVYSIGILSACALIAAIDCDVNQFKHARDIGAYFGMTPKTFQSGERNPQLGITKAGNDLLRRILVECANVALLANAMRTDIKLKGLRICACGSKISKKKAKLAVARCLAVQVVALLKHPERKYVPLSKEGEEGFKRYDAEQAYRGMRKNTKTAKNVIVA